MPKTTNPTKTFTYYRVAISQGRGGYLDRNFDNAVDALAHAHKTRDKHKDGEYAEYWGSVQLTVQKVTETVEDVKEVLRSHITEMVA